MSEARANRKSPVRMATVLLHRVLAAVAPRRTVASSITSSWYRVARWVSSQTTADITTASASASEPSAELRGQQRQQRPEPLAAGIDEVLGDVGDELVLGPHRRLQRRLDDLQALPDGCFQRGVVELDPDRPQRGLVSHPRNFAALSARSSSGCGKTPNTRVAAVPTVIAMVDSGDGMVTVGPSSAGSAKNIITTMRR